jgi:hypothetical protein
MRSTLTKMQPSSLAKAGESKPGRWGGTPLSARRCGHGGPLTPRRPAFQTVRCSRQGSHAAQARRAAWRCRVWVLPGDGGKGV